MARSSITFTTDHKIKASEFIENSSGVTTQLPFDPNSTHTVHVKEIRESYNSIQYFKTSGILYCKEIIEENSGSSTGPTSTVLHHGGDTYYWTTTGSNYTNSSNSSYYVMPIPAEYSHLEIYLGAAIASADGTEEYVNSLKAGYESKLIELDINGIEEVDSNHLSVCYDVANDVGVSEFSDIGYIYFDLNFTNGLLTFDSYNWNINDGTYTGVIFIDQIIAHS
jgi:hypothetical protein